MTPEVLSGWVIAGAVAYVLLLLNGARQGIAHTLERLFVGLIVYAIAQAVLSIHRDIHPGVSTVAAVVAAYAVVSFSKVGKRRSRHIPAKVRRQVIARDLKGEKFDSKRHHVDHIVPFARGGSHTADNLRVIAKDKNLRKGKKLPSLLDWF